MAQPEIELIRIDRVDSDCSEIGQQALLWCDNGNHKATPWLSSFGEWGLSAKIYQLGEMGFHPNCLALYVGIDKDDLACYVTFDPDF